MISKKKSASLVNKAVKVVGTKYRLSQLTGVSPTSVGRWVVGGGVSPVHALKIELATGGAVTKEELRPDAFVTQEVAA